MIRLESASARLPSRRVGIAGVAVVACGIAALFAVPLALQADHLLTSQDDPLAITEIGLKASFDADLARREIEAALAAKDADLARSFVDLAADRGLKLPTDLIDRVAVAVAKEQSLPNQAEVFARGFITGEPDSMVGLAGTTLGDLFVFGDVRDATREGARYIKGEKVDELVLGLSVVGLAITAGTYASFGAGAPARIGLSAVKGARRAGRLGAGLADWIGRSVREVVDFSALRRAGGSLADPAAAARIARTAVRGDKADGLLKLASDVGQVQTKAGTRAAMDGLRLASGPRDVARVAKVAEKHGGKTRAILKTLGRGAILLSIASFNLATWMFSALLTLVGFIVAAKSGVERLTQRSLDRAKVRRAHSALDIRTNAAPAFA